MPWVESQGCYVCRKAFRAMDLPMAAADALFLWAETPWPLHVGVGRAGQPSTTGLDTLPSPAAVSRWRRGGADAAPVATSLGQWSGATEHLRDLITTCGLAHCRHGPVPPSCGRWFPELHAGVARDRSRPLWQVDLIAVYLAGGAVYVKVQP